MRKGLGYFLSTLMVLSLCLMVTNVVHAAGEHQLSLIAYNCDTLDEDLACMGPDGDYPDELPEFESGAKVAPGKVIKVAVYYTPGDTTDKAMQIGFNYDPDVVEPLYDGDELYVETDMSTTYQGGMWPAAGTSTAKKKQTNWHVLGNDEVAASEVKLLVEDAQLSTELEDEGTIAWIYFTVKDTANASDPIPFTYDYVNGVDQGYTRMAKKTPITVSNISLSVFGETSDVKTLGSLSVKNGATSYPLTPTFVENDTTTKSYSTIVPNQISSIDLAATAYESHATISSGTGTKPLDVGDNDFDITVISQSGNTETYQVSVYRLNNDSSLSTLNLSGVNIGTFSSSTTSYSATVPYATSSTVVSATPTDTKASIDSGTGTWNLTNTGETLNTKDIVVKAENCKSQYSSVPGNTCSSTTYQVNVTRSTASSDATLKDLTINGSTISGFAPGTVTYNLPDVNNDVTSLTIGAEVNDTGKATITSTLGTKSLSVGDNAIVVTVKAENGDTKDYTVNVRRLSNDGKLKSLTVTSTPTGSMSPSFSSTNYGAYTYTAPATATEVTISGETNDSNATITSGTGTFEIASNPNVDVIVTAEDGSTTTYSVKLERAKSDNNFLKSLSVDGYTLSPAFNKNTTSYTINVDGTVDEVNVNAEVEDTGRATITSGTGTKTLSTGANTITVTVKAENNDTKDYTITVNKAKKTVSALSDLKVDGVTVTNFNEATLSYDLPDVAFSKKSVLITATPKDSSATVTSGTGTINLNTGDNALHVVVTAEDGITQTTYTINIKRDKDNNAYLSDIKVDGTTIDGFNKLVNDYNLTVSNETTSLNLAVTKESEIASYVVSGNENFSTTANNEVTILVTAEDGTTNTYKLNVTRKKSDNNYLKSLTSNVGTLNPTFVKTTNDYVIEVDRSVTTITLTPEVEVSTSTAQVQGPSELTIGDNEFTITVTSESNKVNTYNVTVKRKPSSNTFLSSLTVDDTLVSGFNKNTLTYTMNVDSTKQNIKIDATAEDEHATVDGTGTFNLITGTNEFNVTVKAEDTTVSDRVYKVVVNKSKSNNNLLNSLSIDETTISPTFDPATTSYTANVDYDVTKIHVNADASDNSATVTGDGEHNLNTGENTITITVTAEDNTPKDYTIKVTRTKNNNAKLSNLAVSGGYSLDKTFDPDDEEYTVSVPNETSTIEIIANPQDPNVTSITNTGNQSLNTGDNEFNIVVTAENGTTTKTYKLTINREKSNDATLKGLTVSKGSLNPAFDPDTDSYTVTVDNEVTDLTITPTTNSDAATAVVSGGTDLSVGDNDATVTVTAEDGSLKVYNIKITRQESANNFLSALSVKDTNNTEYITSFDKSTTTYNITVENNIDEVTIAATKEDPASSMSGDTGTKTLAVNLNQFEIVVTSESNIERTYIINITRKENSNNKLSSLSIDGYTISPAFDPDTQNYTLTVDPTVNSVTINADAEESTSTVEGTGEKPLTSGDNELKVTVTAQDGTPKTYTITVTKEKSSNNYLANLVINDVALDSFNKETLTYELEVANDVTKVTLAGDPEDSKSTVTGMGEKNLTVGENSFNIVVKAENDDERTYTVKVTRKASDNSYLSDLTIDGVTIDGFNKDTLSYNLNVPNDKDSMEIVATAEDGSATVTGDGTINLQSGENTIPITVTAEDGSFKTYQITVNRAKNANNYLSSLEVVDETISPEFNKETDTYTLTVPYEKSDLTVNALPEVSTSTVAITGNTGLQVGSNTITITVTAENETDKIYKINVTRQEQLNNFLNSITVKDASENVYQLSPVFNKDNLNYEVEIPESLSSVNIAVEKAQDDLTVNGDGNVSITSLPQTHNIEVIQNGSARTYKIEFKKGKSNNNKLLSLSVTPGELDPAFNADTDTYTVNLTAPVASIEVNGEKGDSTQTIDGLGSHDLTSGDNTITVTVTSEAGSIKVYTINVNVPSTPTPTDNKLSSLTVSKGTLDPAFDPDVHTYTVDLDDEETEIEITATGDYPITGDGTKTLVKGPNVFTVTTTGPDGDVEYRIVVNNGTVENSTKLSDLAIPGEQLNETFNPDITSYTATVITTDTTLEVSATPEDSGATATVTGNTGLQVGQNTITITVTKDGVEPTTYTIVVDIVEDKIKSTVHTIDDDYVQTINPSKTVTDIKSEMTNPATYLKIYDRDDNEMSDSDIVVTGCTIKLIINSNEYDSKVLIIKGDINSDGMVNVADYTRLRKHTLGQITLVTYQLEAAKLNTDELVNVADYTRLRKHILGTIDLFAKEGE